MKTILFAAALVVASISSLSPASAQVSGNFNANLNNINDQILNNGAAQRALCQARPTRACAEGQRQQPGQRTTSQRRTGQKGGSARP